MTAKLDQAPYFAGNGPQFSVQAAVSAGGGGPFLSSRELGKVYNGPDGKRWQKVVAAATLTQAAVASNLIYWPTGTGVTVDTDLTDSLAGLNSVAGCIAADQSPLPTAGQYFWVLQEGTAIALNGITGVNFVAKAKIIASSTVGNITCLTEATAPTSQLLGIVYTAVDHSGGAGVVVCNFEVPSRLY